MKNQNTFANKCLIHSLVAFMVVFSIIVPMVGCAKVLQTLQTVLAKAPSVIAIVDTAIDLVNVIDPTAADPNLKATVNGIASEAVKDVNSLVQLITTYQNDLASAPPGALQQANTLVAAIDAQLASLTAAFHLKSAKAQAQAALIADGVTLFLNELVSFVPAAVAAQTSAISAHAATANKKVKVVSAHTFAQNFNKASVKNFPQIQIAVPN